MSATPDQRVGLRGERGPILLSVMLSIGLAAVDTTILATALPSIVSDLGGLTASAWLFSGYLVAQAVTVPIYGKLADMFGRKRIMLFGIITFLAASLLCGVAWSTPVLIAFRILQGLGAGAVQPIGQTILGDIYTLEERAKVAGYIASVWATASIVGPTLGGVFSQYLSWRWIFFVNLPIGLAAIWMLTRRYRESEREARRHRIDIAGSVALALGLGLLLAALLEGGSDWGWTSIPTIAALSGSLLSFLAFVLIERRAKEPVMPLWVFRHRVLMPNMLVAILVAMVMMAVTVYLPFYMQNVRGLPALVSGIPLAAMTLGTPLGATQVGRLYLRFGFRATMTGGAIVVAGSMTSLLLVDADTSIVYITVVCLLLGFGVGFCNPAGLVAAQTSVTWENRGVATAMNQLSRTGGSAIGTAVYGAVFAIVAGGAIEAAEGLDGAATVPAVHSVFIAASIAGSLAILAALAMPSRVRKPD